MFLTCFWDTRWNPWFVQEIPLHGRWCHKFTPKRSCVCPLKQDVQFGKKVLFLMPKAVICLYEVLTKCKWEKLTSFDIIAMLWYATPVACINLLRNIAVCVDCVMIWCKVNFRAFICMENSNQILTKQGKINAGNLYYSQKLKDQTYSWMFKKMHSHH